MTWINAGIVNNDNAYTDGYSSSGGVGTVAYTSGRTQFQPAVAVDQSTGTLVVSWRDARDDAANARVATYITTSIDGGQTFSAQTYANPANTAVDTITGLTDVLGPQADNQSGSNPQRDGTFGYGNQMGLAVADGQLFPVWSGNLNQSFYNTSTGSVNAYGLSIWYRPMVIAAGPRVINSTMGPIPLAEAASGTVSISVTFDRPVTAASFVTGDVQVFYHSTSNSTGLVPLTVTGITPVAGTGSSTLGYTQFTVTFNPLPTGAPAPYDYTGTYSYLIAPNNGSGTAISSPIWSYVNGVLRMNDPMDQNADGTPDQNAVTTSFVGTTPGDVYAVPTPQPSTAIDFNGATSILSPPFNQNTLPIIVPGPQVLSTTVPNGNSAEGNLITNGTTSTMSVTFDRPIKTSSFGTGQVLQIMGPAGAITGPQYFPSNSTGQIIPAATSATAPGTLSSTLTIPSYAGTFKVAHISVQLTAAFPTDSALTAVLIAPDGTQVTLFSGVGGNGSNFVNTVFDDGAESSIGTGTAPFTGTFQPTGQLSTLIGKMVDTTITTANPSNPNPWVAGTWTLKLTNSLTGVTGMLDNWSLNITPQVSVTPVSPANGAASQFTIGFPLQQLSGTYTIQLSPTIQDTFGDQLDTNQNAGLDVLRGIDQNGPTTPVHYIAEDLPKSIPSPTGTTAGQVTSSISVPDNFIIAGDKTASGASVMQVQLSLTYPTDSDLTATLTHYGPGNVELGQVVLFSGVGSGSNTANFTNTILDDNAATPIQNGSAPFSSTFNPQQSLATVFAPMPSGMSVQGTWVLTVTNNSTTGGTGTINGWSLSFRKTLPTSGLGEPGADVFTGSFRIFTLAQSSTLSSQAWTAVGPASIGTGSSNPGSDPSGRVTGLAIDPSDPSGNTVYAAGASGGIWKTTDFLTTNASGPTWIPLTDFGPTSGVNIGGIAIFPRNGNPNQSIIIAATGEGDTGTPGVGFLISQDGGATWTLADSTNNVDASGNILPIASASRDRVFVGDSSYAVTVDPTPGPQGVIIYAALSGPTGGIWRSLNTGQSWQLMLSGQATSVVLAPESGTVKNPATNTFVQGNLQVVYAAIRGTGVFISPNQGQVWNQMLGGIGNPLIFNTVKAPYANVNPAASATPTAGGGRITLAVPNSTGNVAQDAVYEGWLYALVANPAGALDGVFVTKDFGQNWTQVRIPTATNQGYQSTPAIPTNDVTLGDYSVIGSAQFPQGNYNQAMAVDPTDPNIIYVGGTRDGNQSGLIRINLTDIWDAHSLVAYSYNANDGGQLTLSSTGPAAVSTNQKPVFSNSLTFDTTQYLNFIRSPENPFVGDATLDVFNYASFTNNGAGVEWIPFDVGGTDYHRMVTMTDPTTGLPRIIFGNDQGIWSVLDSNGTFETQIGSSDILPSTERNGNLQITQFYYGAAQPSNAAALIAGSLFYGSAQDNGGPSSAANIVSSGNIVWNGPGGDATGVATDQQGLGTLYQYWWPCCGGNTTDFFQVNGQGRTSGLLQASNGQPTPDPQWPFTGGANFAVDPVNGQNVLISSSTGNIFATTNEGVTWFDIGQPAVFGTPGSFSVALAYGAPDPTAPSGIGNLGNFMYVGTAKGQIYISQDGGGSGTGNNWLNASLGLDGSSVQSIITDPTRGSHAAYAVTTTGVFYIADSVLLGENPTNTAYEWVNITNNLHNLAYSILGQTYDPTTDPNSRTYNQAAALTSIVADWRYTIPNSASDPNGPGFHPVLYVGADSGVYQSVDDGLTWSLFPSTTFGAVTQGGYLPHVSVTSLSLSLGNINTATGMPSLAGPYQTFLFTGALTSGTATVTNISNVSSLTNGDIVSGTGIPNGTTILSISSSTGTVTLSANATASGAQSLSAVNTSTTPDPDVLMASTYGQGQFAINLAPLVLPSTVQIDPTSLDSSGNVTTATPTFDGLSQITGFGNATRISIVDMTPGDKTYGEIIGGFNPSNLAATNVAANWTIATGNFSVTTYSGLNGFTTNGPKIIDIYGTDNAGSVGNSVTLSFNLAATNLPPLPPTTKPSKVSLQLEPSEAVLVGGVTYTRTSTPEFIGVTDTSVTSVELLQVSGGVDTPFSPAVITTSIDPITGSFALLLPSSKDGTYTVVAMATNAVGSLDSSPVTFTIKTHGPTQAPTLALDPVDDSGIVGDNITNVHKPYFMGTVGAANAIGTLVEIFQADSNGIPTGFPLATATPSSNGSFSIQLPKALVNGTTSLIAEAVDVVGNPAPGNSPVVKVTEVTVGSDYSGNLSDYNSTPIVYPASGSSINQPIGSATTNSLNSALTISSQNPSATVASLTVQLNITSLNLADLSAVLIGPDGKTTVTLFTAGTLAGTSLGSTILSDKATTSLITGSAPYAGTYLTVDPKGLAQLAGQVVNGTWTLKLTDTVTGNTSTLTNWSLAITPNPVTTAQTFSVTTPGTIPSAPTSLISPLTITGQGSTTTVGNLSVTLNLTYANLADLSAVLIGPDGSTQVTLFTAGSLTGSSLVNTVFSVSATTALSAGTAPYTGTFKPTDPNGLAELIGQSMNGTWKLRVTNTATGQTGTLTNWSLTLTPLPVTTPQTFPLVPGSTISPLPA